MTKSKMADKLVMYRSNVKFDRIITVISLYPLRIYLSHSSWCKCRVAAVKSLIVLHYSVVYLFWIFVIMEHRADSGTFLKSNWSKLTSLTQKPWHLSYCQFYEWIHCSQGAFRLGSIITQTRLFKYIENFSTKLKVSHKNSDIFFIFLLNT